MWRCVAGVVLLASMSACTRKTCDDAGLKAAATALADRSTLGRRAGLQALSRACPGFPAALEQRLVAQYDAAAADPLLRPAPDAQDDEALVARTCLRVPADRETAVAEDDAAMRASCKLDRYGLLAANEPFVADDLEAFMVYEWLTSVGGDPLVARAIARRLMFVGASTPEREAMCRSRGSGCTWLIAHRGIDLPRSTSNAPLEPGVEVMITGSDVTVDGVRVLELANATFEHRVEPSLRRKFSDTAEAGRTAATASRAPGDPSRYVATVSHPAFRGTDLDACVLDPLDVAAKPADPFSSNDEPTTVVLAIPVVLDLDGLQ